MKRILVLGAVVILTMALISGGTWAYFSDPETSEDNTLTAGTLDLSTPVLVWDATFDTLAPGVETLDSTLTVTNNSNIAVDHIELSFTVDGFVDDEDRETDALGAPVGTDDAATFSAKINLVTLTWSVGARNLLWGPDGIDDSGAGDDIATLDDLNGAAFDGVAAPAGAADGILTIRVELDSTADDQFQGDAIDLSVELTLMQDVSQ